MPIAHLRSLRLRVLPWEDDMSADEQKVLEMLSVRSHPLVQALLEVAFNALDFYTRVLALDFWSRSFMTITANMVFSMMKASSITDFFWQTAACGALQINAS